MTIDPRLRLAPSVLLVARSVRLVAPSVLLVALAAAMPRPAAAESELTHEKYELGNGMTVILHEDHSLPVAAVNIWYAVGAKDEPEGRSGFAHLFEHLMFEGTKRVPGAQFDEIMEAGGGSNNATTNYDRTNYFESGPSSLLPTLLWLEADRMEAVGRAMTQEKLDAQRAVVRNERRQSYENAPYGEAWLEIPKVMYPKDHPYHETVIGSHEDLEAATVEDVKDFFDTFYVPSNATLVVAGDFVPAEIKPVIERLFGTMPTGPAPEHASADPVTLDGPRRLVLSDEVQLPKVMMAWHSPAFFEPGDAEMDLLSGVLGRGKDSRLHRRLVHEEKICSDVSSYQASRELGSQFFIEATCAADADLDRVEHLIEEELSALRVDGPTEGELTRVRNQLEHAALQRLENIQERADQLNLYEHYFGNPDSLERDLDRYREASVRGVRQAAKNVLQPNERLVVRVLAGSPRDERPPAGDPPDFELPEPETFQLANGLTVHHWEREQLPLVAMRLVLPGGALLDHPEQAGLASLALDILDEGTEDRSALELARALETLGAQLTTSTEPEHATVSLRALERNFPEAAVLFAEALLRPAFEREDWQRVQRLRLDALRQEQDDPSAVARNLARRFAFGDDHPHATPVTGTLDAVQNIDLADVRDAYRALARPAEATLLTAGAISTNDLKSLLGPLLGDWRAKGPAPELPAVAQAAEQDMRFFFVDRPGAVQSVVRFAWPAPSYGVEDRIAREMLNTIFGGSFTSRLNQNLREEHGYTYGAGSGLGLYPSAGYAIAASQVRTDVTGASLAEFVAEFTRLRSGTITPEERSKAAATVRNRLVDDTAGLGGLLGVAETLLVNGLPFSAYDADLAAVEAVDAAALDELAVTAVRPERGVLVVVGDRESVLPQLKELELPDPIFIDVEGETVGEAVGVEAGGAAGQ